MSQDKPERRTRRNAIATRAALLKEAHDHFTREGYDSVGIRDIAASVGVDAALIIRYFGSKERLFTEAITQDFDLSALVVGDRATLGERLARYILHKGEQSFDPLLALLRSGSNERTEALRHAIDEQFIKPLAQWLEGEYAIQRAGLISAYLLGILVTREMIGSEFLAANETEVLIRLIAPTLQSYVDGSLSIS